CGYFGAAKDRGKLDFMEVATRLPVIALYTIFGSELLDGGLKRYLHNKGNCSEVLTKDKDGLLKAASLDEIPEIAKKLPGDYKANVNKLFKDKAVISMAPFLFSMLVIGSFITLMTRIWTKKRYESGIGNDNFQKDYTAPVKNLKEFAA
ncbi:MAG: hypothetical protein LBJ74_06120, partial [Heliobacteriaceae bacterium]|nr:hypothetical protein [Heliobacteriaceae bacterium]